MSHKNGFSLTQFPLSFCHYTLKKTYNVKGSRSSENQNYEDKTFGGKLKNEKK